MDGVLTPGGRETRPLQVFDKLEFGGDAPAGNAFWTAAMELHHWVSLDRLLVSARRMKLALAPSLRGLSEIFDF